jgi:hypothetical protein
MIFGLHIAYALNALAALALRSSTSVNAATVLERQEQQVARNDIIGAYYYKEIPEGDLPDDPSQKYIYHQQALVNARFPDAGTHRWSWFFDRIGIAKDVKHGDPGYGCQVALYFDDVKERFDQCKSSSNGTGAAWASPSIMSPWCNSTLDFIQDNTYPDDAYGLKTVRPDNDPRYHSIIMLLR